MNISFDMMNEILSLYKKQGQISAIHDFIHYYDEKIAEVKIISKVEFTDRSTLVVKLTKENEHPFHKIESQSGFSEYIRSQGVLTPKRYASDGKYCVCYKLNNLEVAVTVEDFLGDELKAIDFNLSYKIGQLLGKIHRISEDGKCLIGSNTIFDFCGYNEVSGYETLCKLGEAGNIDSAMYLKIKGLHTERFERVRRIWSRLPRFATQGDISINNLSMIDGNLGIFDYNIAGDETLIGDMVLEGLLTANEMELAEGVTDNDRIELFRRFVEGYQTERPLSDDEKNVFRDMYSISSAFWFTKIKYNENALEKLVERNETDQVGKLLEGIYNNLSRPLVDV